MENINFLRKGKMEFDYKITKIFFVIFTFLGLGGPFRAIYTTFRRESTYTYENALKRLSLLDNIFENVKLF